MSAREKNTGRSPEGRNVDPPQGLKRIRTHSSRILTSSFYLISKIWKDLVKETPSVPTGGYYLLLEDNITGTIRSLRTKSLSRRDLVREEDRTVLLRFF